MGRKTPRVKETPAAMSRRRREFDFNGREVADILLDFCRANGHDVSPGAQRWITGLESDAGGVCITVLGD